jgi:mono/diheme cytochrome c family protein
MRLSRLRVLVPFALPVGIGLLAALAGWPRRSASAGAERFVAPAEARQPASTRRKWRAAALACIAALIAAAGLYGAYTAQEARRRSEAAVALTGGDPDKAPAYMTRYGCAGCHTIPGVRGARGRVGPPLDGVARQVYVGGVVTNTPDNLIRWIVDPRRIDPKSAMPATGISRAEARDVAAYLYGL